MKIAERKFLEKAIICSLLVFAFLPKTFASDKKYNPQDKKQILDLCPNLLETAIGINLKKLKAVPDKDLRNRFLEYFIPALAGEDGSSDVKKLLDIADHVIIFGVYGYHGKYLIFQTDSSFDKWKKLPYLFYGKPQKIEYIDEGNGKYKILRYFTLPSNREVKISSNSLIFGSLANDFPNNAVFYGIPEHVTLQDILGGIKGECPILDSPSDDKNKVRIHGGSHTFAELLNKVDLNTDFWWIYRKGRWGAISFFACIGQLNFDSSVGQIEILCNPEKNPNELEKQVFYNILSTGIAPAFKKFFTSKVQNGKIILSLKNGNTAFQFLALKHREYNPKTVKPVDKKTRSHLESFLNNIVWLRSDKRSSPKNIQELMNLRLTPQDVTSPCDPTTQPVTKDNYPKDDFIYIPLPIGSPRHLILVYENPKYYDNKGTNVLLEDRSMKWLDIEEFNRRMEEYRELIESDGK